MYMFHYFNQIDLSEGKKVYIVYLWNCFDMNVPYGIDLITISLNEIQAIKQFTAKKGINPLNAKSSIFPCQTLGGIIDLCEDNHES